MLTHLDLFSGIGGFTLAAQWAGFQTVAFSEIEPYAIRVLHKHWPSVPNLGDIRAADLSTLGRIDLITGGFPCQPFSLAGKQRGKEDDRHLWPAMRDVIAKVRPTWVVCENVPGIIKLAIDDVLSDLEAISYPAIPFTVPACAVDAKHRRDRVWIVAYTDSPRLQERVMQPGVRAETMGAQQGEDVGGNSEALANANSNNEQRRSSDVQMGRIRLEREAARDGSAGGTEWPTEPGVGRVAHGIPNRVDRLRGLGNAIVPQVALEILRHIAAIERGEMK